MKTLGVLVKILAISVIIESVLLCLVCYRQVKELTFLQQTVATYQAMPHYYTLPNGTIEQIGSDCYPYRNCLQKNDQYPQP